MSDIHFSNLRVLATSPLLNPKLKYLGLGLEAGNYDGVYDVTKGILYLLNRKRLQNYVAIKVTISEMFELVSSMKSNPEAYTFTKEDLKIIAGMTTNNNRPSSFSGTGGYVAHHIIPLEVCRNTLFIVRAKKFTNFDENSHQFNRLLLPHLFHKGSHPRYSDLTKLVLEEQWEILVDDGQAENGVAIQLKLIELLDFFKDTLNDLVKKGHCTIKDI